MQKTQNHFGGNILVLYVAYLLLLKKMVAPSINYYHQLNPINDVLDVTRLYIVHLSVKNMITPRGSTNQAV